MVRPSPRRPVLPALHWPDSPRLACWRITRMTEYPNDRFPGYDVLSKRRSPSWNEVTRQVVNRRLAVPRQPRYSNAEEFVTLEAICDRILPQPKHRPKVPLAAYVDARLSDGPGDGYRFADLPEAADAWR